MIFLAALLGLLTQDRPDISADPPCRPAETARATVAEIGSDPGRFVERCVRVSGLLYHGILHGDRESLYRARLNSWDGGPLRSPAAYHLWVDGDARRTLRNETPVPATVVGRIDTCAQRRERHRRQISGPAEIVVASFHCYAANGVLLVAGEVAMRGGRAERMTGEPARARFGNLVRMPADWPGRAGLEGLTQRFVAALRSNDREQVARIHGIGPHPRAASSEEARRLLAYLFDDPQSPFAPFRRAAPSQIAFFVPRLDDSGRFQPGDQAAIACFCRSADCRDRWPISTIDIRHQPGRPYACTRVIARDWVPGGVELESDWRQTGPMEPMRSAVR